MSFVWETPEEINLALAKRLSRIRKRRNLSQVQLSEKSNVSCLMHGADCSWIVCCKAGGFPPQT